VRKVDLNDRYGRETFYLVFCLEKDGRMDFLYMFTPRKRKSTYIVKRDLKGQLIIDLQRSRVSKTV